ncbi:DUF742 domain-containing protein [Streptomyces sp. NPDC005813]|uniref:DUF742 domain-containing protein n=1 Tax=Streptomyces sp. NPDC005813 TaxID=3155592 RepID=UPI0033F4B122
MTAGEPSAIDDAGWEAEPPASFVRPFLLTAGRIAGGDSLVPPIPIETQVVATDLGLAALDAFVFEQHRDIIAICREPQSLAEIAAKLRMHLNVIRVLADDLRADGQLVLYAPAHSNRDVTVLRRVIDGLRAVPDSRGAIREG